MFPAPYLPGCQSWLPQPQQVGVGAERPEQKVYADDHPEGEGSHQLSVRHGPEKAFGKK